MTTASALQRRLPEAARAWLAEARLLPLGEAFPAAARKVGRADLPPSAESAVAPRAAPADPAPARAAGGAGWTTDLALRALLLVGADATDVLDVYRYGDAAEKLAVLRGLDLEEVSAALGDKGLPVLEDAIRTNDQRLLAAALGSYATEYLPTASFRQAVLKCVFAGVPLVVVDGLPTRADDALVRMMADFAAERTAAGREIPADLELYLEPFRRGV